MNSVFALLLCAYHYDFTLLLQYHYYTTYDRTLFSPVATAFYFANHARRVAGSSPTAQGGAVRGVFVCRWPVAHDTSQHRRRRCICTGTAQHEENSIESQRRRPHRFAVWLQRGQSCGCGDKFSLSSQATKQANPFLFCTKQTRRPGEGVV